MGRLTINAAATSTASPDRVWALLSDVDTWTSWAGFKHASLDRKAEGTDPNGVGAIRRFSRPGSTSVEEVVAYEPCSLLAYTLLEGLPLPNYRAEVRLAPEGAGTKITWTSTFDATVKSRGAKLILAPFLNKLAANLAEAAAL